MRGSDGGAEDGERTTKMMDTAPPPEILLARPLADSRKKFT